MFNESSLNLAEFDSESSDLDLMVIAAEKDDVSIREISCQVACLVHPSIFVTREWVRNKHFGCQFWSIEVPSRDSYSSNIEFSNGSNRYRLLMLVEEVDRLVGNRATNRYEVTVKVS
jgi:hypothetical protein